MNFYIVSSTHWDREWYEPFQKYRFRLVRMMDALIEILENNPDYNSFHMDGQTVVLQDYLKIRPEKAKRLKKLIQDGKIEIGPWYTMPEEWLVSGESLIKNLQTGKKICEEYKVKSSPCGYICDLFGHNSQMPQIFKQFGLTSTAFFRGVEDTHKDLFIWQGADGSEILVNKMHRDYAYSTFYFVVRFPFENREFDKEEIIRRFGDFIKKEQSEGNFALDNVLLMDGVDHIDPINELPDLISILKEGFPEHTFTHCNMQTYFATVEKQISELEKFTGCFYDVAEYGVNQAVLKNCLSSIVDQKQDNSYCETQLEKVVSPLNFLLANLPAQQSEKHFRSVAPYNDFFDEAWNLLIQNHAHDSICGCSVSATHLDTKNRFKNVREIIDVTKKNLLLELSRQVNTKSTEYDGAWVIFNTSQKDINGVSVVELPLKVTEKGRNLRIFDENGIMLDYSIISKTEEFEKDADFNILIRFPETDYLTTVLPLNIKAGGYQTLFYKCLTCEKEPNSWEWKRYNPPYRLEGSMRTDAYTFDTGKIIVKVKKNGTLKVTNKATGKEYKNLLTFEDNGDAGEGWNSVPPEFDCTYSSIANDACVAIEKDNKFVTVIKIINRMWLPVKSDSQTRSEQKTDFIIENTITLLKDSSKISIVTKVNNQITNHRLRVVLPTGIKAEKFNTSLPFDFYAWDVKKKSNTYMKERDTFVNPNQGAVSISSGEDTFAIYNKGLYEVSVMDDEQRTAYLTLFRSFTLESGTLKESSLGKMIGEYSFEYQLDFLQNASSKEILENATSYKAGLCAVETKINSGNLPCNMQFAKIEGDAVFSILQGGVKLNGKEFSQIRIYDTVGGCSGKISFFKPVKKAYLTNLKGDIIKECHLNEGKIEYSLKNREIATFIFQFEK